MKGLQNLQATGLCIIFSGTVMIFAEEIGIEFSKILIPALFAIAGIMAILFARSNKDNSKARQYHLIQGVGIIIFSILIAFFADSLGMFLNHLSFFVLFFGILEFTIAFSALNSSEINWKILVFRFIGGVLGFFGGFVLIMTSFSSPLKTVLLAGIFTITWGASLIMFSVKAK